MTASSTFVALNHYFVKHRGKAVGFSLAGTAFGMMLMPQAVRLLLEEYNFRGAILILGGFASHAILGSALLEPAARHFVPETKDDVEEGVYHQVCKKLLKKKEFTLKFFCVDKEDMDFNFHFSFFFLLFKRSCKGLASISLLPR